MKQLNHNASVLFKFDNKLIKLNITKNIRNASKTLENMYENLKDSDPLKLYLKNNCLHLLTLSGSIGIFATNQPIITGYDNYFIKSNDKKNHPNIFNGKSGVYLIECIETGFQYIGSAVCLNTRFKSHLVNSIRPSRGGNSALYLAVRELGWERFTWKPILITNNYIITFLQQNPGLDLGIESLSILRSFTQFEARLYEQAFLTHYLPKLNSGFTVLFPFVNLQKSNLPQLDSSIPLTVKGPNLEILLVYPSKNRAAISLGIPNTTLARYINLENYSVFSPVLNMNVFLVDPSLPLSQDSPIYCHSELPLISDVDLWQFEKGKLFALKKRCMEFLILLVMLHWVLTENLTVNILDGI